MVSDTKQPEAPVIDGRRERWNDHRAHRREALVNAGLRAIDELGPAASAEEIAELAGVNRTVLYRYFRDKEDLGAAIAERAVSLFAAEVLPELRSRTTPADVIRGAVGASLTWLEGHQNLYAFVRDRRVGTSGSIDSAVVTVGDELARLFARILGEFGLNVARAEPTAYMVIGMVETTSAWWLRTGARSYDDVADQLCAAIWHVLQGTLGDNGIRLVAHRPLSDQRAGNTVETMYE